MGTVYEYIEELSPYAGYVRGRPEVVFGGHERIKVQVKYTSGASTFTWFDHDDPELDRRVFRFLLGDDVARNNECFGKGKNIGVVRERVPPKLRSLFDRIVEESQAEISQIQ